MGPKDRQVSENVLRILKGMSVAEVAVASVTPLIAMAQSSSNTSAAYDVSSATTQSASLLPSVNLPMIEKLKCCFGKSPKGKSKSKPPKKLEPGQSKPPKKLEPGKSEPGVDLNKKGGGESGVDLNKKGGGESGVDLNKKGGNESGVDLNKKGGDEQESEEEAAGQEGGCGARKAETVGEKAAAFHADFLSNPRLGIGVSLPMQEEDYSALCQKAGESVLNNLTGVLERMGAPAGAVDGLDWAKGVIGMVVGSLPGLFCAPMGDGTTLAGLDDQLGQKALDRCKSELDGARVQGGGSSTDESKYKDEDGNVVTEKEYLKSCQKKKTKAAKEQVQGALDPRETYGDTECATPAKVWEWAVNGNVFMRSFAQVEKGKPMLARDDKGLMVADGTNSGTVQAVEDGDIVAHAEIYFDCSLGDKGEEKRWMECRSEAPWQLRWRARLRRVQPFAQLLATAIEPGLVATVTSMFEGGGEWLDGKLGDKRLTRIIVPKLHDTAAFDWVTRDVVQTGLYDWGGFSTVGEFIIQHSDRPATIH